MPAPADPRPGEARVQHLTLGTQERRPRVCQGCQFWQSRALGRPVDRRRWAEDVEERFGAWGKIYVESGQHIASLQYGPSWAFPRAYDLPAGPPSDDAVVATCAYLSDPTSPWALQSLFLACIGEVRDAGLPALEAFAYRYPPEQDFAARFLVHRTIFPRDFLGDLGFQTLRSAGQVELVRLEMRGIIPVEEPESMLAWAARRARELAARPATATLSSAPVKGDPTAP